MAEDVNGLTMERILALLGRGQKPTPFTGWDPVGAPEGLPLPAAGPATPTPPPGLDPGESSAAWGAGAPSGLPAPGQPRTIDLNWAPTSPPGQSHPAGAMGSLFGVGAAAVGGLPQPGQQPAFQMPQFQMPQLTRPGPVSQLPPVQPFGDSSLMPSDANAILGNGQGLAGMASWRANPLGAVGNPEDRVRAEAVGAQTLAPYAALAGQAESSAAHLNSQRLQNQAEYAKLNSAQALGQQKAQGDQENAILAAQSHLGGSMLGAQGQAASANIQGQAHTRAAEIDAAAKTGPHAAYNQGVAALIAGMAGGTVQPDAVKAGMELLRGGLGGGTPGAASNSGQTPEQVLDRIARANQASKTAGAPFVGPEGKPNDTVGGIKSGHDFLDRLAAQGVDVDGPQFKQIMADARSGKFGDVQKVRESIAKSLLHANLRLQPPKYPKGHAKEGQPIDFLSAGPNDIPAMYGMNGPDNQPLLSASIAPAVTGNLGKAVRTLGGSRAIPYDRLQVAGGPQFNIDPTELGNAYGERLNQIPQSVLLNRLGYGAYALNQLGR